MHRSEVEAFAAVNRPASHRPAGARASGVLGQRIGPARPDKASLTTFAMWPDDAPARTAFVDRSFAPRLGCARTPIRGGKVDSFSFDKIAPYLKDPLVLIGFTLLLFFGIARAIIRSGLLRPVTGAKSYRVLQTVLLYGFLLGVLVIALGFGLKYRELSEADQRNAIELLKGEFNANAATVESLRRNTMTLLSVFQQTAQSVREPGVPALNTLFPVENIQSGPQPVPRELALNALTMLLDKRLDKNKVEMAKGDAVAKLVHGTIGRTRSTIVSLSDPKHERYVISDSAWSANLSVLRQVHLAGVPKFQDAYAAARKLRSDYDVVCAGVLAYLDALQTLFDPKVGVNPDTLTAALTQERQSLALLTAYGTTLADAVERVKTLQSTLNNIGRATI